MVCAVCIQCLVASERLILLKLLWFLPLGVAAALVKNVGFLFFFPSENVSVFSVISALHKGCR
jgi:hypothetical protein